MYWKYTIKAKDAVQFWYRGYIAEGTVRGMVKNDAYHDIEENGVENIEPGDLEIVVNSGGRDVTVSLDEVEDRVKFEDRESDLPGLGEEFRFNRSVDQIDKQVEAQECEQ